MANVANHSKCYRAARNDSDSTVSIVLVINNAILRIPKRSNKKTVEKEAIRNQCQDKDVFPTVSPVCLLLPYQVTQFQTSFPLADLAKRGGREEKRTNQHR